eukprot:GHVU01129901.1.p3 GENE.GHVU01129901.1~~GHVU01129901.1.p3  ORF type:complete len:178 (+),score=34.84 GHVU01129901.1:66-536(+)
MRNAIKVNMVKNPQEVVAQLLPKCEPSQILPVFNITEGSCSTLDNFLERVARERGKLKRGGVPDLDEAARLVLSYWAGGKIRHFSTPPVGEDEGCQGPEVIVGAPDVDLTAVWVDNDKDMELMQGATLTMMQQGATPTMLHKNQSMMKGAAVDVSM